MLNYWWDFAVWVYFTRFHNWICFSYPADERPVLARRLTATVTNSSVFHLAGPIYYSGSNYSYYPSLSSALGANFTISLWVKPVVTSTNSEMFLISLNRNSTNVRGVFVLSILPGGNVSYYELTTASNYGIKIITSKVIITGIEYYFKHR